MFLRLGSRRFDLSERPVVVGILNRTRDSFFDAARTSSWTRCWPAPSNWSPTAPMCWRWGARPGGVGVADVPLDRERDLVAESLAEFRSRFDVPLGVDTTRATVARAAFAEGRSWATT